jgi:hypothetical protein
MFDVRVARAVSDASDSDPQVTLTVWSEEEHGPAPYSPDAVITGGPDISTLVLKVRAERAVPGNGRIYLVRIVASDFDGNTSSACSTVIVPLNFTTSHIAALQAEADLAVAVCDTTGGPPPGYGVLATNAIVIP